jgi:hypothetical protein
VEIHEGRNSMLLVDDTSASGRRLHEREHEDITIRAWGWGSRFWRCLPSVEQKKRTHNGMCR